MRVDVVQNPVERQQLERLDQAHVVQWDVDRFLGLVPQLAAVKTGEAPPGRKRAWLAHSMARSTLALLPLPERAISMSSADARFLSCSTKIDSNPSSLAQARMAVRIIGEAQHLEPLSRSVGKVGPLEGRFAQVLGDVRAIGPAPTVAAEKHEPPFVVGRMDLGGKPFDGRRFDPRKLGGGARDIAKQSSWLPA